MKEQEIYFKADVEKTIDRWERTIYPYDADHDQKRAIKSVLIELQYPYLKPTTGILLTKEELVKLIMDFTEKYSEGKGTKFLREKGLL